MMCARDVMILCFFCAETKRSRVREMQLRISNRMPNERTIIIFNICQLEWYCVVLAAFAKINSDDGH